MMENIFSTEHKVQIGNLIIEQQEQSGLSQNAFARSKGFHGADISNLKHESWKKNQQLISGEKWVRFARLANFQPNSNMVWNTAETSLKKYIDNQLDICRNYSFTGMLIDEAGIGKTHACKEYARRNPRVFYIDCSNARTRQRFMRKMATVVGADCTGCSADETFETAIYILGAMDRPLVILDEAGDLDDKAILEIKRMYNSLEGACGFYLVGADGLKNKMQRGIKNAKQGFLEMYSRFGKKFSRKTPNDLKERRSFMISMARQILNANGIKDKAVQNELIKPLIEEGLKDMRTVRRELIKYRIKNQQANAPVL